MAKLMIGISFGLLSKNMGIKPKRRWHSYGTGKLVSARFLGPYGRLGIPEKKTYGYCQRDEAKRADFLAQLENPKAPQLVYVIDALVMTGI